MGTRFRALAPAAFFMRGRGCAAARGPNADRAVFYMTDDSRDVQQRIETRLRELQLLFEQLRGALARRIETLRDDPALPGAEFEREIVAASRISLKFAEEENRLEEYRSRAAGAVDRSHIAFAAARSEIGRRLDRLRAAGDGGGVSGEPE